MPIVDIGMGLDYVYAMNHLYPFEIYFASYIENNCSIKDASFMIHFIFDIYKNDGNGCTSLKELIVSY